MKRAVVLGLVASFVTIVAACKRGGEHTCASDPAAGCMCRNETFQLESPGMKAVAECGSPPTGVVWSCCHDLDSKGETTDCRCARAVCVEGGGMPCHCGLYVGILAGNTVKPSCEPAAGQVCCQSNKTGSCTCDKYAGCGPDSVQVERCGTANVKPLSCAGGRREAKTCDGLKWKAAEKKEEKK